MTQINFKPIFPSPLGYVNFGNANKELNKQLIKDMEQERKEHNDGGTRTFRKNDASWQSLGLMEDRWESFATLKEHIRDACIPILKHSGISDTVAPFVNIANLWGNIILSAGGFSKPHIHGSGNTLWSGVYYPKGVEKVDDLDNFDEEKTILNGWVRKDGILILIDPSYNIKSLIATEYDSREFYGSDVSIIPRESLLILFPTWMMHMVTPLTTNEKRYSISFAIDKPK
jgi:hypothetical protein